jgi:bacterial/archaeal transporter family-2 protein
MEPGKFLWGVSKQVIKQNKRNIMQNYVLLLVAVAAGAVLPLQAALNTKMGHIVHSPFISSFISFVAGAVSLLIYMIVTKLPLPNIIHAKAAPAYLWMAGLLGAFYVTSVIILVPKLGVALTFGLVIGGQMAVSLLFDHFGLFGLPVRQVSFFRLLGVLFLVTGVILIRKF